MVIDFKKEKPRETSLVNLNKYRDSFDPETHAAEWISQRGKDGCSGSILDLLTDAEQIKENIFYLWSVLVGSVPFGTLGIRFSALLAEVQDILMLFPNEEECSKKEWQIFLDLAKLKESLTSAGV